MIVLQSRNKIKNFLIIGDNEIIRFYWHVSPRAGRKGEYVKEIIPITKEDREEIIKVQMGICDDVTSCVPIRLIQLLTVQEIVRLKL